MSRIPSFDRNKQSVAAAECEARRCIGPMVAHRSSFNASSLGGVSTVLAVVMWSLDFLERHNAIRIYEALTFRELQSGGRRMADELVPEETERKTANQVHNLV